MLLIGCKNDMRNSSTSENSLKFSAKKSGLIDSTALDDPRIIKSCFLNRTTVCVKFYQRLSFGFHGSVSSMFNPYTLEI